MTSREVDATFGWDERARGFLSGSAVLLGLGLAGMANGTARSGDSAPTNLSVDANSVPASVLCALPGLGPVLSGRIVEAREFRPFTSMDDFDRRVYGIGPAKVAALRPFLRFEAVSHP